MDKSIKFLMYCIGAFFLFKILLFIGILLALCVGMLFGC